MTSPAQRVGEASPRRGNVGTVARFLLPKIGQALFVVWASYTVAFLLIHALPGDPILAALAVRGGDATTTEPAVLDELRARYGLDGPLWQQYLGGFFGRQVI